MFGFRTSQLSGTLVQVDIGLLADEVGVSATDTLDLGQGVDNLLLAVNVGVEQTQDELEVRLLQRVWRVSTFRPNADATIELFSGGIYLLARHERHVGQPWLMDAASKCRCPASRKKIERKCSGREAVGQVEIDFLWRWSVRIPRD